MKIEEQIKGLIEKALHMECTKVLMITPKRGIFTVKYNAACSGIGGTEETLKFWIRNGSLVLE